MSEGSDLLSQPRGKLKRARLGTVQKKILVVLLEAQMQRQRTGEPFTGLPYRAIHARLHHQAVLGDGQWLQTVHARLLAEQGQWAESNQQLLKGIELAARLVRNEVDHDLLPHPYLSDDTRLLLTGVAEEADDIRSAAFLVRHVPEGEELEAVHTILLSLARRVGLLVPGGSWLQYRGDEYLTLDEEEKAHAERALTVQHASLSRALRLLEAHRLIEQQEVKFNHFGNSERRYLITEAGSRRLSEEVQGPGD